MLFETRRNNGERTVSYSDAFFSSTLKRKNIMILKRSIKKFTKKLTSEGKKRAVLDQTHKTSYEGTRDKMFSSKSGFLEKEKKKPLEKRACQPKHESKVSTFFLCRKKFGNSLGGTRVTAVFYDCSFVVGNWIYYIERE